MNKDGYDKVPRFLQTETKEPWNSLMVSDYKDMKLDLEAYTSGRLDIDALTRNPNLDSYYLFCFLHCAFVTFLFISNCLLFLTKRINLQ